MASSESCLWPKFADVESIMGIRSFSSLEPESVHMLCGYETVVVKQKTVNVLYLISEGNPSGQASKYWSVAQVNKCIDSNLVFPCLLAYKGVKRLNGSAGTVHSLNIGSIPQQFKHLELSYLSWRKSLVSLSVNDFESFIIC